MIFKGINYSIRISQGDIPNFRKVPFPVVVADNCEAIIFIGDNIVTRVAEGQMDLAVIAYMAVHYLLDMDYPPSYDVPLTILQYLIFEDQKTPADILKYTDQAWKEFCNFKYKVQLMKF